MMKDLKHYLALATILSVGFGLYWMFNFNRQVQVWITMGMGCVYVLWGITYHALRRELYFARNKLVYLRIILEYILVAALASIVVIFLLLRT